MCWRLGPCRECWRWSASRREQKEDERIRAEWQGMLPYHHFGKFIRTLPVTSSTGIKELRRYLAKDHSDARKTLAMIRAIAAAQWQKRLFEKSEIRRSRCGMPIRRYTTFLCNHCFTPGCENPHAVHCIVIIFMYDLTLLPYLLLHYTVNILIRV